MNKRIYLLPVAFALMLGACKKSPLTQYDESSTIYFKAARGTTGREPSPNDSMAFSFLYMQADTFIVKIPVSVAGRAQAIDRPFEVVADTGSTAALGKHMTILSAVIRANSLNDTLFVKVNRTPDMATAKLLMRLKLKPNQYFGTDFAIRNLDTRKIQMDVYRIFVTSTAIQPERWLEAYFGKFSAKKAKLMTELFGFNFETDFNAPYGPTSSISFVTSGGGAMARYLQDMEDAGTPVYEEDGTKMAMGSVFNNL
ncbi:DUF4843 domain-containing protein [Chitinophaga pollutisoli]|uniref:DUF4843 domain-containing protein n=1 Tax=Chitinophaga pollutisoli TaxID=3133966 RepID=A0ABZ2YL92_9BACT